MKLVDVLTPLVPVLGNFKANNKLRKKLNNNPGQGEESLQTPLSESSNPDAITVENLKEQYIDALKTKDKFEDKAKATIICVTISVSLIMGASGLLNTVASHFDFPLVKWLSYVLFLYAVLSMILAAIMDIKVLVDENTVFTVPADCPEEEIRETYDIYVGKNFTQNLIRNNYVFTAYECIRNALICLFVIMVIAVIPIHGSGTVTASHSKSYSQKGYSYSETTINTLGQHNTTDIKDIIETALASMQTTDGEIYNIVDSLNGLFIKFQINGNDICVLSIEEISWERSSLERHEKTTDNDSE